MSSLCDPTLHRTSLLCEGLPKRAPRPDIRDRGKIKPARRRSCLRRRRLVVQTKHAFCYGTDVATPDTRHPHFEPGNTELETGKTRHPRFKRFERPLLLLFCCALLSACGDSAGSGGTAAPHAVVRGERTWVDTTRPTARGSVRVAESRTLRTVIWQAVSDEPVPLLVIAHGFSGLPEKLAAMANRIAAAGYVVVAPAFPLTNQNTPNGPYLPDVRQQPADVSFVLDRLLEANADPVDPLYGRIEANAVAVLGHSLGGTTTIALTRKDCCRDPRVIVSLLFAPGPIELFDQLFGADPTESGPPTMLLQGDLDPIIGYEGSYRYFGEIDAPKVFIGITGASHSDAIEADDEPLTYLESVGERAIVAFLDREFRGAREAFADMRASLDAEGHYTEAVAP